MFFVLIAFQCSGFSSEKMENFALKTLEGKTVSLNAMLKKGPVLLDFWATWCRPCIISFPEMETLYQKYKEMGFTILAVNEDAARNLDRVAPTVNSLKLTFPVLLDPGNELMSKLRLQFLPTTILIAQDGTILDTSVGFKPDKGKKLAAMLDKIFEEKKK